MANVIFKRGNGAPSKYDDGTLYFSLDTARITMGTSDGPVTFSDVKVLTSEPSDTTGLQDGKLYISKDKIYFIKDKVEGGKELVIIGDTTALADLKKAVDKLTNPEVGEDDEPAEGSIAAMLKELKEKLIGDSTSATADDDTIAGAKKYAEELIKGDSQDPDAGLKIVKAETPEDGYAATYKLMQDGEQLGASINLIKDQFLDDVKLVTSKPGANEGDAPIDGKFIHMTFKDSNKSEIYLDVGDLVDTYSSGSGDNDIVKIVVDDSGNTISATVTNGSITKEKLHADIQASLTLADSALQKSDADALYKELYGDDRPADGKDKLTLKSINDKLTSGGAEWGNFDDIPNESEEET